MTCKVWPQWQDITTEARKQDRGMKTRSRHGLYSSTPGLWAEEWCRKGNTVLLQISYSFRSKTREKIIPFSSVRATPNSLIVWAVKQPFCQNYFSLTTRLHKSHCSFHSLSDITDANSVLYQSICGISYVTSQFDSILLNDKPCGVKGIVMSIHNFCIKLLYLMPCILDDMKVVFFHLPLSKERSETGKQSRVTAMTCQAQECLLALSWLLLGRLSLGKRTVMISKLFLSQCVSTAYRFVLG